MKKSFLTLGFIFSLFLITFATTVYAKPTIRDQINKLCSGSEKGGVIEYLCNLVDENASLQSQVNYYKNCVNDFIDNNNGTVTDKCSGLVWQKTNSTSHPNWNEAIDYCSNLTLGGSSDWRLPNIKELANIIDYSQNNPKIDPVFALVPDIFGEYYIWTSTPEENRSWDVNFAFGRNGYSQRTETLEALCVR